MFVVNDLIRFISIVGEDVKGKYDYTLTELHYAVNQAIEKPISERTFRRILKGLKVSKSSSGYYNPPDGMVITGWLKHGHKFSSYKEYMEKQGRQLYEKAMEIDYDAY